MKYLENRGVIIISNFICDYQPLIGLHQFVFGSTDAARCDLTVDEKLSRSKWEIFHLLSNVEVASDEACSLVVIVKTYLPHAKLFC